MKIYRQKHTICIHIDKKANKLFYKALESISNCFDNIILVKKREDVIYAHFTRLQVDYCNNTCQTLNNYTESYFRPISIA